MDRADGALVGVVNARYGRMLALQTDTFVSHALLQHGEFSESEVALWRSFIEPHWIAVDVGANIGAHTIALARMAARVIAFEPLSFPFHMLCGSLALNGLTNVQAFNLAVGAERGQMTVPWIDYTQRQAYGGWAPGFKGGKGALVVPLDEVVPVVDFLKIDVEGMELDVLRGAERLIRASEPVIYVEAQANQQQIIDFLREHDYAMYWHHAPHYNPDNFRANPVNDLPDAPAPALVAFPIGDDETFENFIPAEVAALERLT